MEAEEVQPQLQEEMEVMLVEVEVAEELQLLEVKEVTELFGFFLGKLK
jgi:hypothetical protein